MSNHSEIDLSKVIGIDTRSATAIIHYLHPNGKERGGIQTLPLTEAFALVSRGIEEGQLLNIKTKANRNGIDAINPHHFKAVSLKYETGEFVDQNLLRPAFNSRGQEFGVPWDPEDEDMKQRLSGWIEVTTDDDYLLVNPLFRDNYKQHLAPEAAQS